MQLTVAVTGAGGFIGSHLVETLVAATVAWICRPGNLRYYDLHRYSI